MNTDVYEQLLQLKNLATPLNAWSKTATALCQRLTQQQMKMAEANMSRCSDQWKRLANARKIEDLLTLQNQIVSENMYAGMKAAQECSQTLMGTVDDLSKMGNTAMKKTQAATHTAVKKTQAATRKMTKSTRRRSKKK